MRPITRLPALLCGVLLIGGLLSACGSHHESAAEAQNDATAKVLQARAGLASNLSFVGIYDAVAHTGRKATVRVWIRPGSYRVEVTVGSVTAALFGSPSGTVACPESAGMTTVCYSVAKPGQAIPAEFDAGVQRIFTQDLPTLAKNADAFDLIESTPLPAVISADADARCFQLIGPNTSAPLSQPITNLVDLGTYCLSSTGLPVLFDFASGTLTLVSHSGPPTNGDMTPPAPPKRLPVPLETPTGSPSPSTSFPVILPSASASSSGSASPSS